MHNAVQTEHNAEISTFQIKNCRMCLAKSVCNIQWAWWPLTFWPANSLALYPTENSEVLSRSGIIWNCSFNTKIVTYGLQLNCTPKSAGKKISQMCRFLLEAYASSHLNNINCQVKIPPVSCTCCSKESHKFSIRLRSSELQANQSVCLCHPLQTSHTDLALCTLQLLSYNQGVSVLCSVLTWSTKGNLRMAILNQFASNQFCNITERDWDCLLRTGGT